MTRWARFDTESTVEAKRRGSRKDVKEVESALKLATMPLILYGFACFVCYRCAERVEF